jgi:2-keto-4-pentenoate hydratase
VDNTADSSSAAAFILGPAHDFRQLNESDGTVQLFEQEVLIAQGRVQGTLGGPLLALQWLARQLFDRSMALEQGMIILTGGLTFCQRRAYLSSRT